MKKIIILVPGIFLLALLPLTMNSSAQIPQVSFLPIVLVPSRLSQMELAVTCSQWLDSEIFVMKGDGSARKQLTFNHGPEVDPLHYVAVDADPDWSANGRQIGFISGRDFDRFSIYVMDADGSNQARITDQPGESPKWSPDGKRIAFLSYSEQGASSSVYVMDVDGSNPIWLADDAVREADLAWSPDGQWLVVSQVVIQEEGSLFRLSKIKADGSETRVLWAPDHGVVYAINGLDWPRGGDKIYFDYEYYWGMFGEVRHGIFSIRADGSQSWPDFLVEGRSPAWAPDGQVLAFVFDDQVRGSQIGLLTPDGTFYKDLTSPVEYEQCSLPAWSPVIGAP